MIIKQLSAPATATPQPTTFFCNPNTINYVVDTCFAVDICISAHLISVNRQPVNLLLFSTNLLYLDVDTLSAMGTRQQHIYSTLNMEIYKLLIFCILDVFICCFLQMNDFIFSFLHRVCRFLRMYL